ncbi:MAG TPA: hypothetical protein VGH20_00515 [Myxococcales bacterium]
MKQIFLAGEGRTELGGWSFARPYRSPTPEIAVLEALLRRVVPSGWVIKDAIVWKDIPKAKPGDFRKPETRNVLGAALKARESHCDVLVFSRDRDRGEAREHAIEAAIKEISANQTMKVAGGVAIEEIESWVLSCRGHAGAEGLRDAKAAAAKDLFGKTLVEHLQDFNPDDLTADASSLRRWIDRVRKALS